MAKKILSRRQINNLVRQLAKKAKEKEMPISRAFVFGSYAKNRMNKFSDLDLCFISPKFNNPIEAEAYLRTQLFFLNPNLHIPVDVVAYKPKDFAKFSLLAYEIKKNGWEVKIY